MGEPLAAGMPIADRYVVEALIGTGGMAEVYKVRHTELGSVHALKVLTWRKKGLAERFLNEGRVQASLGHPNVVTVTDILRFDGFTALVMEYVDGISLEQWIAERGPLPVQEAFALFVPILAAVAAAHDRGVLHRDLKPANVLLADTPVGWVPKVVDFGIAKFVEEEMGAGSTTSGMVMGTAGYMAPEQVRDSSTVDQRADIFALAAILFEVLTGRRAFEDADGSLTITSTIDREPPPLEVPDLSPSMSAAIRKAMSRNRDDRYPDCRSFARALGLGAHPLLLDMAERRALGRTFDAPMSTGTPQIRTSPSLVPPSVAPPSLPSVPPAVPPPERTTWLVVPFVAGMFVLLAMAGLVVVAALVYAGVRAQWDRPAEVAELPPISAPAPAPAQAPTPGATAATPEPVEAAPAGSPSDGATLSQAPTPGAPAPVPALASSAPAPAPAVAPTASAVLEPSPSPAPETAPETAVPPAPAPPTPEPAVAAPTPAPAPAPAPAVAVASPAPAPKPAPFDPMTVLGGTWKGKASGRPFELRFTGSSNGMVTAVAEFPTGTSSRTERLSGTFDRASGRLALSSDGGIRFEGTLSGSALSGTYSSGGGKALEWSVSR